jgi:hypothetical protein
MKCENCNKEHDRSYGSGRFCSSECSRSFSTKEKRSLINDKIKKSLKGKYIGTQYKSGGFKKGYDKNRLVISSEVAKKICQKRKNRIDEFIINSDYESLTLLTHKKKKILLEQNFVCQKCKLNEWNNESLILEFHHIDGNNKNNKKENVVYLCPNCHSQTKNWRNRKRIAQVMEW